MEGKGGPASCESAGFSLKTVVSMKCTVRPGADLGEASSQLASRLHTGRKSRSSSPPGTHSRDTTGGDYAAVGLISHANECAHGDHVRTLTRWGALDSLTSTTE